MTYETALQNSINDLNQLSASCESEMKSWGEIKPEVIMKTPSDLDGWDYCLSLGIGMGSAVITTTEKLGVYLNGIHDAASGASGTSGLQSFLGSMLHHQGDSMDQIDGQFINRAGDPAYGLYHRLLWGHDPLDFGVDNPYRLMFRQRGIFGILQATRHLIADTMSKQGLPLPGSSHLDFRNDNGRISNYLIDISQELSRASIGNLRSAQDIYSHMFTLRAQDILGGGAIAGFNNIYFKIRGITDDIRKTQFRIISYTVAFLGQAMIGAIRQHGVPYINYALATAAIKNTVQLYYYSLMKTHQLRDITNQQIAEDRKLEEMVLDANYGLQSYDNASGYFKESADIDDTADSLIEDFEKGGSL